MDFNHITKEYNQDRINTVIINEKISNKKSRNLDSYSVTDDTRDVLQSFTYSWLWQILNTFLADIHCTNNEVSIKAFFSKCDQIRRKLRIWSHLLEKSLMEDIIFCAVIVTSPVPFWISQTPTTSSNKPAAFNPIMPIQ